MCDMAFADKFVGMSATRKPSRVRALILATALTLMPLTACSGGGTKSETDTRDIPFKPRLAGGGTIVPLTDSASYDPADASNDGRWVAYVDYVGEETKLFLTDTKTGKVRASNVTVTDYPIAISGDGSCVVFTRPSKAGDAAWLWEIASDKKMRIGPTTGSWEASVSNDCQTVLFPAFKKGLLLLDRKTHTLTTVAPKDVPVMYSQISGNGQWAVYREIDSGRAALWSRATNTTTYLPFNGLANVDISTDGNTVLVSRVGKVSSVAKRAAVYDRRTKRVTLSPRPMYAEAISPDGTAVFGVRHIARSVTTDEDDRDQVERWDIRKNQITALTPLESYISGWHVAAVSNSQVVFTGVDLTLGEPDATRIWRWQAKD